MIEILLKNLKKIVIVLLDYVFLLFIVTPLVVLIWWGVWSVTDYLLSDNCTSISAFIAIGGEFVLLYYYDEIKKLLGIENKVISAILHPIYGLTCGIVTIFFWRFAWMFYDEITYNDDGSLIFNLIQNSLILMGFKAFANTLSVPFISRFNPTDPIPQSITYYCKSKTDGIFTYLSDCICTILITTLVIFVWRDLWTLANIKIYPYSDYKSTIASLLIGYSAAIVCFAIHQSINFLCNIFNDFRIFYRNIHACLCLVASINIWRGYWMLFTYIANGSIFITTAICVTSLALLIIMGNSDYLAFAALLSDGNRIRFQYDYISSLFKPATSNITENSKEPNV